MLTRRGFLVALPLSAADLPRYDAAQLRREMLLLPEWFVARHLGVTLTPAEEGVVLDAFGFLERVALAQPVVLAHRDYHSRNLMVTDRNPGVLDFQDAVYGPVTYDLVSLLRDAYIEWEEERQLDWAVRYWEKARAASIPVDPDFGSFWRDFEWMGVQRQIKVLGIFARLCHRDGKRGYLEDMPLVMRYLRAACGHRAGCRQSDTGTATNDDDALAIPTHCCADMLAADRVTMFAASSSAAAKNGVWLVFIEMTRSHGVLASMASCRAGVTARSCSVLT